jgi:hypothetical protein
LQALQQWGVGKRDEQTERFLRLSSLAVAEAVLKSGTPSGDGSRAILNYRAADLYCSLLHTLFRHMNSGASQDQVNAQRLGVLNKILGVIVRTMMWHCKLADTAGKSWDQRPWYRLFLNLVMDVNKPDPVIEPIRLGVLSVFGCAFHVCQPLVMPGSCLTSLSRSWSSCSLTSLFARRRFRFCLVRPSVPSTFPTKSLVATGSKSVAYSTRTYHRPISVP